MSARNRVRRVIQMSFDCRGFSIRLSFVLLALVALICGFWSAILGFSGAAALGQIWRIRIIARMGGYTRDCLGGVQQMAELGLLLGLSLML